MVKLGVFENQDPFAAFTWAKTKGTALSTLIHPTLPETGKLKVVKHICNNNQQSPGVIFQHSLLYQQTVIALH